MNQKYLVALLLSVVAITGAVAVVIRLENSPVRVDKSSLTVSESAHGRTASQERRIPIKSSMPKTARLPWTNEGATVADASSSVVRVPDKFQPSSATSLDMLHGMNNRQAELSFQRLAGNPSNIHIAKATLEITGAALEQQQATGFNNRKSPKYVMSLCRDQSGNIWVAAENDANNTGGAWRYDVSNGNWTQFTTKNGLGDDNGYAIVCDKHGRIWVGHLNSGVSVYNGDRWQCYEPIGGMSRKDSLSGPLGERVFDLAVCPTDGDVWIATNAGLARYSDSKGTWSYFTKLDGLPSDDVQAIAFDADGNLYCGMQCHGLAIGSPIDGYGSWRKGSGLDKAPSAPAGRGLPISSINDVLVTRDGTLWVATVAGLARSKDHGQTFEYWRGRDWAAKIPAKTGGGPKEKPASALGAWLAEDYVTSIAEDDQENLLIGYRTQGFQRLEKGGRIREEALPKAFVTAFSPSRFPGDISATGTYGDMGFVLSGQPAAGLRKNDAGANSNNLVSRALPEAAEASNDALMARNLRSLQTVEPWGSIHEAYAVCLIDDWRTQGAWQGRYGTTWTCLAGAGFGSDLVYEASKGAAKFTARIGYNAMPQDGLRYWMSSAETHDTRSLELPDVPPGVVPEFHRSMERNYIRRQAEWDDHGEAYKWRTTEGPNLYITIEVPQGLHQISLYNTNKDGHGSVTRYRDYIVKIKENNSQGSMNDIRGFTEAKELARTRFKDFYGGVYKRFLVTGPHRYTFEIDRCYSLNAILAGVMLDPIFEDSAPNQRKIGPRASGVEASALNQWVDQKGWVDKFAIQSDPNQLCYTYTAVLKLIAELNPIAHQVHLEHSAPPYIRLLISSQKLSRKPELIDEVSEQLRAARYVAQP